jgi:antitoxin VapB
MPLYIKDDTIAALVAALSAERGIKTQEAVRLAVSNELGRHAAAVPLRERIAAWHAAHPLPAATGLVADKRFFDEVSGEM